MNLLGGIKAVAKLAVNNVVAKTLLTEVIGYATPGLSTSLKNAIINFAENAKETPNPWDDLLAAFLLDLFDIDLPDEGK